MGKKKTKKKTVDPQSPPKYAMLSALTGIISPDRYAFMDLVNKKTLDILGPDWISNVKTNAPLFKKQTALKNLIGFGENKCVIGVGAGTCFNKNKHILEETLNHDGVNDWDDRDFITIASNHQYKPLLEMGVIPDFVLLVDAADTVYDQLCTDIPKSGQNTILITAIQCSPKILNAWAKQGRTIAFYVSPAKELEEAFYKHTGKNPKLHSLELGGNCLNGAWRIGLSVFGSRVHICVGNDLSFPIYKSLDKQRDNYYSDGDYTTNTASKRDEAKSQKKWAGFTLTDSPLYSLTGKKDDRYNIELNEVGTSYTLFVYKTWLETALMNQTHNPNASFHYFNCTEGGVLGVMAKDEKDIENMNYAESWFMLDEKCRFYKTAKLRDAVRSFLEAKEAMECHNRTMKDAPAVECLR
ncbi:DUF115 domain-containing protein [Candidatus Pacearchaeota archaeon]|nr:DUF115 domain-containing protein [Candidatus Pacearchaeota archaeon]